MLFSNPAAWLASARIPPRFLTPCSQEPPLRRALRRLRPAASFRPFFARRQEPSARSFACFESTRSSPLNLEEVVEWNSRQQSKQTAFQPPDADCGKSRSLLSARHSTPFPADCFLVRIQRPSFEIRYSAPGWRVKVRVRPERYPGPVAPFSDRRFPCACDHRRFKVRPANGLLCEPLSPKRRDSQTGPF